METYRRSILQGPRGELTGEIVETLKKNSLKPAVNDGEHSYSNTRITPKQPPPFRENDQFELSLCSNNFDVTEFENSYIHLRLNFRFAFSGLGTVNGIQGIQDWFNTKFNNAPAGEKKDEYRGCFTDLENDLLDNQYVFIGFKSSSHCVGSYSFKFHDKPMSSTQQSQAITEQFLYSNFKAQGEISNKKYVHSPWDEVHDFDHSTCGIYVPLRKILGNDPNSSYYEIEVVIPYNEFLIMQDFDEYPNCIFGDLKIVLQIVQNGMVFAEVNPLTSIRKGIACGNIEAYKAAGSPGRNVDSIPGDLSTEERAKRVGTYAEGMTSVLAIDEHTLPYTHAFNQINLPDQVCFIAGLDDLTPKTYTAPEFKITVMELSVREAYVDCRGYKMSTPAREAAYNWFSQNPFTVLAQKVTRNPFPTPPQKSDLSTNMNVRLNRVTDVYILMPKNSAETTVFTNPDLKNFQLQIGNMTYPTQAIGTSSPEFHEQQMQQTDFDSFMEATPSYEESLCRPRGDSKGFLKPMRDDTSYVPVFMMERANAGPLTFDGLDSPNEKIELRGSPHYHDFPLYFTNSNIIDTRGNHGEITGAVPPPMFCQSSDTYWIFRIDKGMANAQYITNSDYQTAYADPSLENTVAPIQG